MLKQLLACLAVVAILVLSALYIIERTQNSKWERRVQEVEAEVVALNVTADSAKFKADSLMVAADSLWFELERQEPEIREVIRIVRAEVPVPEPCLPIVTQRDSIITELLEQMEQRDTVIVQQRHAFDALLVSHASLEAAVDSLTDVLGDRPIRLPSLIPEIGLGVTAGICTTGQPCVAVGVQLKWDIPFLGG